MSERATQVGVADRSDPPAVEGRSASAGAGRAPLGPETPAEKLRNALMILNAASVQDLHATDEPLTAYRDVDVQAIQRLVASAIELLDSGHDQVRRNLERARAEIRRLKATTAAPHPRGIVRVMSPSRDSGDYSEETLIVALSDGSFRRYWPNASPGQRWEELEPIPSTRKAILSGDLAYQESRA